MSPRKTGATPIAPAPTADRRGWRRWDTLALRLFVLMWAALVLSHLAAYHVVTRDMGPGGPGGPSGHSEAPPTRGGPPPGNPRMGTPPDHPRPQRDGHPSPPGGPSGHAHRADGPPLPPLPSLPPGPSFGHDDAAHGPSLSLGAWMLDIGIRLLLIGCAAWWGSRWLAGPMRRLVHASGALDPALARGQTAPLLPTDDGTREVREAAEVFNHMARQLQARFEERGLMMAAISHDLRTPLTRLRLRLETGEVDEPLRERCGQDIARMNELIDDVLQMFRPAGADESPQVRVDLAALAQSAVDDLADTGAAVSFDGGTAIVASRPLALRRVIDNLLGNAVRYAGQARVRIERSARVTRLVVEDTGPGIPEGDLERVMHPFRRLESSRNRATGGVGLGLYIAQQLARREGAQLRLANRPEGGLRAELEWAAA